MSRSRSRPRPDQIAELTRGLRLPLPAIPSALLDIILETIDRAWNELSRDPGNPLSNDKNEIEITSLLQIRLNRIRQHDAMFSQLVTGVVRGAEAISFDGSKMEKRPDLTLYLTNRNPNFPLVVECKIIDRDAQKGVDLYCREGLRRFLEGDYAWTNREAVMLAYVRDSSSIEDALLPHLRTLATRPPDAMRTELMPAGRAGSRASRSRHGRGFRYTGPTENASPGPIDLWHMWMHTSGANINGVPTSGR